MRYQDYVIKDGVFIGEFEKMYQKFDDPWYQTKEARSSYSRNDTVTTIRRLGIRSILEIGCGLGYFTKLISDSCPSVKISAMDISATAIQKAKSVFPELDFFQGDIKDISQILSSQASGVEAIIFPEIMWYILDDLKNVLQEIKEYFADIGGYLIVNQTFYKGGQQYGKEFFTTQDEMIRYINFEVLIKTNAIIIENSNSYETHTVFKV